MRTVWKNALRLLMAAAACFLLSLGARAWDQACNGPPPWPEEQDTAPSRVEDESTATTERAEVSVVVFAAVSGRGERDPASDPAPEEAVSVEYRVTVEVLAPKPAPPESAEAPEPEPSRPEEATPAAPREAERTWTYVSSDGRPLWRLRLAGRFLEGTCLQAWGEAEALSEAWRIESAEFRPAGAVAAALVTVTRQALGVPVSRETWEFRLPPPEREE